jgi:hypothetical protein
MGAGELLSETIDVVEVAVALVLVFLVQFGIVEFFIVEFGSILVAAGLVGWFPMLGIWNF